MEIKARLFRQYPFGELASHVIGYIGRISPADKQRIEEVASSFLAGAEVVAGGSAAPAH